MAAVLYLEVKEVPRRLLAVLIGRYGRVICTTSAEVAISIGRKLCLGVFLVDYLLKESLSAALRWMGDRIPQDRERE